MGIGGGKSSGNQSTQVQLTPEQQELLKTQTDFLKNTALPAYQNTIAGAGNVYNQASGQVANAANTASNVAGQTGALQQGVGASSLLTGAAGLASLFGPQYKQEQVNAALQAGRETSRELQNQQDASFGGAGGGGSARQALANSNLASLNAQRQATAAATASAGVEANRAAAAQALYGGGASNLAGANQAAAARIGYAGAPQDAYAKYASIIYGTPQSSTTPNFSGTQGSTSSGSGKGAGFQFGK
jgi:hypothetical protein